MLEVQGSMQPNLKSQVGFFLAKQVAGPLVDGEGEARTSGIELALRKEITELCEYAHDTETYT